MSVDLTDHWPVTLVAAMCALFIAGMGGALAGSGPCYPGLRFPAWKPPNWSFGPISMGVLTLAAARAGLAWRSAVPAQQRIGLVVLFAVSGSLDMVWNMLFFSFRRPDWPLVETPFLWLSILALIVYISPISTKASLPLAPCLIWVAIAVVLNRAIVRLNVPFSGRTDIRTS
jgi:tryptophan-rich sensory protein